MKVLYFVYYLFRRLIRRPNSYHIIRDVIDAKNYVEIGQELRIIHRDYEHCLRKSAIWRLTREQIVNGLKADAIKIIHSKYENYGLLDISYFQPCVKAWQPAEAAQPPPNSNFLFRTNKEWQKWIYIAEQRVWGKNISPFSN
jgi:hypothetical protein